MAVQDSLRAAHSEERVTRGLSEWKFQSHSMDGRVLEFHCENGIEAVVLLIVFRVSKFCWICSYLGTIPFGATLSAY